MIRKPGSKSVILNLCGKFIMNLGTEYLVCMQLSAPENMGRVIVSDKHWEMEICFYYWCCFKNLRAKDKPEKLRKRCHDLGKMMFQF